MTRAPRRIVTAAAAALSLGLLASACSSSTKSASSTTTSTTSAASQLESLAPPSATVALTETGSTLLFPLFNLWAPDYQKAYSNISITTAGTGSGTGIAQAASGAVNIGASDAYLSQSQLSANPTLLNIPLAVSAQVIEYNLPGVSGNLKLNGQILSAMYQGTITNWNDPKIAAINPGVTLPNLPVVPVHRSDGSGDTFLFSTYLSDQDASGWGQKIGEGTTVPFPAVPNSLAANGNGGMVTTCGATKGCVAYVGISFLSKASQAGLGEAQVANGSGQYVMPSAQTIQSELQPFVTKTPASESISLINGDGYPIINYEYAIVNSSQSSATTAQAIRAFLAWASDPSHGNQSSYLNQVGFQPLPASVLAKSLTQIKKIQ